MKRIIYLITILGTILVGCNPLDDINNAIDKENQGIVGVAEYTLTSDDYTDDIEDGGLGLSYESIDSEDDAKSILPAFLAYHYPYLGEGSSVLVEYNLYVGNAFDIRDYNLDQTDYTFSGSNGLGFNSDSTPSDYLADILLDRVSNPTSGDYRLAKYYQYTGDIIIVTPTVSLDENFDYGTTSGDLTTMTTNWTGHSGATPFVGYSTTSLSMTDYPSSNIGGASSISVDGDQDINRIFTPITSGTVYASTLINFSAVSSGTYFFHFINDAFGYSARVGAKDNGSGKILFGIGASSSTLTYGTTSFNLNTTYLLVASYNIGTGVSNLYVLSTSVDTEPATPEASNAGTSDLTVEKISIRQGFGGPTGILDGVRVANTWSAIMSNETLPNESIGDKTAGEIYYEFNGTTWGTPSNQFYAITDADFASMNITNFGSSIAPDNYLPQFLSLKYPYAQEDDTMDVGYNYVSSTSGAGARGNLYTYTSGVWTPHQTTIASTLQFGVEDGVFVPDNTIRYTLLSADYIYMGTALVGDTNVTGGLSTLTNYGDYDSSWSQADIVYSLGVLLDKNDPTAAEGQKYLMTYLIYSGGLSELSILLIKEDGKWILKV